jgi:hypothetical protein
LKYKNGTQKAIWSYWQALHAIPYSIPEFPVAWLTYFSVVPGALVAISYRKKTKTSPKPPPING